MPIILELDSKSLGSPHYEMNPYSFNYVLNVSEKCTYAAATKFP